MKSSVFVMAAMAGMLMSCSHTKVIEYPTIEQRN